MSDKIKLIELEIAELESKQRSNNEKIAALGRQYIIGAIGFFLGIILIVIGWVWVGLLIGIAGMLSALTQTFKQRSLRKVNRELEDTLHDQRARLRHYLSTSG